MRTARLSASLVPVRSAGDRVEGAGMHDHTYGQAYADWQAGLRVAARRCHDPGEDEDDGRRARAWRRSDGRRTRGGPPAGDGGSSPGG